MHKFTIKIDKRITEQKLMEYCLNLTYSGYDPIFLMFLYALSKRWRIDKFSYYMDLINRGKDRK